MFFHQSRTCTMGHDPLHGARGNPMACSWFAINSKHFFVITGLGNVRAMFHNYVF